MGAGSGSFDLSFKEKNYRRFVADTRGPFIATQIRFIKKNMAAVAEKKRREKLDRKAAQNRDYRARKKTSTELDEASL